jgi:hypothetical protein
MSGIRGWKILRVRGCTTHLVVQISTHYSFVGLIPIDHKEPVADPGTDALRLIPAFIPIDSTTPDTGVGAGKEGR